MAAITSGWIWSVTGHCATWRWDASIGQRRRIERVIRTDPAYEPGEQEPPRVRAAFATVGGRVLPEIVRATYVDSVPAYDPELLEAVSRWRYAPAQRNGTPVTSTKRVDVVLRPRD